MSTLLRTIIGIVATLAVATAAVVVGIHFQATPQVKTEAVPVLGPLRVDGAATASSGTSNLSPVVGQTTVVTPGQKGASPIGSQVQAQIDALDAADGADPAEAHHIVTGGGSDPATPADDPCSPASGTPASDCPDGVHGAVFADMHYGALTMSLRANPPHAQHDSVFDCPATSPTASQMPFGAVTNIPSDVTLTYWPADGSSTSQTVVIPGAAADLATWNASYASHGNTYNYNEYVFQHCVTLAGFHANTDYVVSATALDSFGRTSDPVLSNFTNRAAPTIPTMMALPLTNSLVYASVPFQNGGQQPLVRGWVVTPGTPADCSSYDQRAQQLRAVQSEGVFQVTADYLRSNNYDPNYSQRVVDIFEVPEGSTIVICARTFNSSAPSWDRTRPTSQQFVSLQSPDAVIPIVTVKRLHLLKAVSGDDISFTGTTQFGSYCGGAFSNGLAEPSSPAAAGSTIAVNRVLCDARESGSADIASVGVTGNIVVSTTSFLGGHTYVSRSTLPLSRYACTGACPTLPPTLDYALALASPVPDRPITSCSDPSGCSYPPSDNQTGSADLEVTWVRGNSNGLSHWAIGLPDNTLTPPPLPDAPRLDLNVGSTSILSADGFTATGGIPIRVDRHVTYGLTLSGECFAPGAPRSYNGETGVLSDSVSSIVQQVTGLCPNTAYNATVTLTDDHGHSSTYSSVSPVDAAHGWPGGYFRTQFDSIRINASFEQTSPGGYYKAWGSTGIDMTANGVNATYDAPFPIECFPESTLAEGVYNLRKTDTLPLASTIHLNVQSGAVQEDLYSGVNHDASCSWPSQTWSFQRIITDVSYTDLYRGIVLTAPHAAGDPFNLTMHVWATNVGVLP
ncbi:MAG: hypothetical protein QOH69_2400 [Actinomycetota bacterium]|jgi:hypothetical protein|nr:hypothetical protein [Actinomycetota bacterium]